MKKIVNSEKVNFLYSGNGLIIWIPLFFLIHFLIPFYIQGYAQFKNDSAILLKEIKILKPKSTILFPSDTLRISQRDLSTHNMNLISTLQERESSHEYSIESQVDSLRQTRTIYILIIGVILTVVLRLIGKKNEKNYRKKVFIIYLLTFLIILFYFLDVNQEDLLVRSNKTKSITSVTLDSLINQKTKDTTWYEIDYSDRKLLLSKLELVDSRVPRKISAMFQKPCPFNFKLNPIQLAFYIFPLIFVYIIYIKILYNKNNTSKISKGQAIKSILYKS